MMGSVFPLDFKKFNDGPIPSDVVGWLKGGEQSKLTPHILSEAQKIYGNTRRERLYRAMRHIWQSFSYDRCYAEFVQLIGIVLLLMLFDLCDPYANCGAKRS